MSCICNPQGTCVCRTPLTITTIPDVLCVDPRHPKLEEELDAAWMAVDLLKKDEEMFLSEHKENVRLHFENVDLKSENARLRKALERIAARCECCDENNQYRECTCFSEPFADQIARDALEDE